MRSKFVKLSNRILNTELVTHFEMQEDGGIKVHFSGCDPIRIEPTDAVGLIGLLQPMEAQLREKRPFRLAR
jgi:hypothetical protein